MTVPVWVRDSPSPRTVQRTFLQQDGPYRNKVPSHLRRQELIQKMLNRERMVFNASNINLLSISFNLFALGPFHIFQDVIIFLIPITYYSISTTIVLNTVPTTDNKHFFVIYLFILKKTSFSSFKFNISEFQQLRNTYVKVHLAIVIQWLGQSPLLNKLGV